MELFLRHKTIWAPSSEFVSSSIPSWQILNAHAQSFRGARDLAFCLKVPLDSVFLWASSGGSGETARMRRLAWTFAARIGDKYQIRLTRSILLSQRMKNPTKWHCAPNEDSAQPAQPRSLIRVFVWRSIGSPRPKMSSREQQRLCCWSESSLGAHTILYVLSCNSSNLISRML